ncbi:MAG: SusC/RagA family TonB-linked outer membrane protein [Prevotella sp.]
MKNKKFIYALVLMAGSVCTMSAQGINVTGKVTDAQGEPLPGVMITSEDGIALGLTNEAGAFNVKNKADNGSLRFRLLGYKNVEVAPKENLNVEMDLDVSCTDEVIDLGYTKENKVTFSGSAATIDGERLNKQPKLKIIGNFSGNLAGLTTTETARELFAESYNMKVRGNSDWHGNKPLVVVDGLPCVDGSIATYYEMLTADEVESVSVLKDAASQALYGTQGTNGVIVITTKRGAPGKLQVKGSFDEGIHQISQTPTFTNSWEYATLRNEAAFNDGLGKNYFYSDEQIANYKAGADKYLYPNTNWYSMLFRKFQHTQKVGVSARGGTDRVRFFSNVNFAHVGGAYHTESNEGLKGSQKYDRNNARFFFNFRSNLDVDITENVSAYLNIAANITKTHQPGINNMVQSIYQMTQAMPSTVYGPLTPEIEGAEYEPDQVIVTERNDNSPYAEVNRRGYSNNTLTNVYANFGLKVDLGFLTQGLSLVGDVAYKGYTDTNTHVSKNYRRYMIDTNSEELNWIRKGTIDNTNLVYGKGQNEWYDLSYRGHIDYARNFGQHHVKGMAYALYQCYEASAVFPYKRVTAGIDANYDFDNRYALRLVMGYGGSDKHHADSRWVTTPAVSAAWIASNEAFLKDFKPLSFAKLRVAYGKTADDRNGLARYAYDDYVTIAQGGPIGYLQYLTQEKSYGNKDLKPETSKKFNVGIDLGFFNWVNLTVDVFKEKISDAVISSTTMIPAFQGIPLSAYPQTNSGSFENKGYEIQLSVGHAFNNGFSFNVGGFVAYNKNKVVNYGETPKDDDYAYRYRTQGYSVGTQWGLIVDKSNGNGFFNFQEEIDNGPKYEFGTPRLGDLKYKDLNEDGVINDKDMAPITKGSLPNYTWGFNGQFQYKNWDLSFLFDAIGSYSYCYSGIGVYETSYDGVYGSLHRNAWTQERWNEGQKITYPALSTQATTNHRASDFFVEDCSYFKLKNLEIGYTLPAACTKGIGISKLRFVLQGQNLFSIDNMKSDDFGPENSYNTLAPYRSYSIGVRATF